MKKDEKGKEIEERYEQNRKSGHAYSPYKSFPERKLNAKQKQLAILAKAGINCPQKNLTRRQGENIQILLGTS